MLPLGFLKISSKDLHAEGKLLWFYSVCELAFTVLIPKGRV